MLMIHCRFQGHICKGFFQFMALSSVNFYIKKHQELSLLLSLIELKMQSGNNTQTIMRLIYLLNFKYMINKKKLLFILERLVQLMLIKLFSMMKF